MKKLLFNLAVLCCCTLLAGCETILSGSDADAVRIRIHNTSSLAMQGISVSFPDQEVSYGDVEAGKKSSYIEISKAYRYAYIETEIQGKTVVLQPIDYVGESLLEEGNYTYALSIYEETFESDEYRYSLALELVRE